MFRRLYYEMSEIIRDQLSDPECDSERRAQIAVFARRAAEKLRRHDPAFSYDWFFGGCGLDNWGELMPESVPVEGKRLK